jgi:hypothetical protein
MSKFAPIALVVSLVFVNACGGGGDGGTKSEGGAQDTLVAKTDSSSAGSDTASTTSDGGALDAAAKTDTAVVQMDTASIADSSVKKDGIIIQPGFVRGTIAGEVFDYNGFVASDVIGGGSGVLRVGGAKAFGGTEKWTVSANNTVGIHPCGTLAEPFSLVGLSRMEGNVLVNYVSNTTGGSCSIEITAAAPNVNDLAKGTFTGTLVDSANAARTIVVTAGAFEAGRYQ